MKTWFKPLCSLGVVHPYYGTRRSRDFAYVFPRDTASLLRNGRLIAKPLDGALCVLFEADAHGAPVVGLAGTTLRIGLQLINPYFSNFTALGFDASSQIALYRNGTDPAHLDAPIPLVPTGPLLAHYLQAADRPVTVTVRDGAGKVVRTETVAAADSRPAVSLDLEGLAPGVLTLTEAYAGNVIKTAPYYLDAELRQMAVFGVAEIKISAGFYADPPEFQITFAAREETLKYFLVARNYTTAEFANLTVVDAGFQDDARPQVKFEKVPASAFTNAEPPASLLERPDAKVELFKSQAAVPRREGGRKKIQLSRNNEVLIENLPQPRADSATADLIVHVSKP